MDTDYFRDHVNHDDELKSRIKICEICGSIQFVESLIWRRTRRRLRARGKTR